MALRASYFKFCKRPEVFVYKPFHSVEGRAILAMGLRALPFVIEEIRNGDVSWNWAAFHIAPMAPLPSDASWEVLVELKSAELLERYSRDWVKWWGEHKSNPALNVFLSN
jgi:hypothetical protein